MAKAKFTWKQNALHELSRQCNAGLFRMGTDIASKARANAPVLTGALRNDIRIHPENGVVYILAGSARVPYARRREYENNAHPWTTHYMGKAYDSVINSDWEHKYFGGITK